MANPETQAYVAGNKLIAGAITTDLKSLAADTYYQGMRLEYQADGVVTAGGSNTGDGTVTLVLAGPNVLAGTWALTLTAALIAELENPNSEVVQEGIALTDGGAEVVRAAGIVMTITDGATAFLAGDTFSIVIEAAGEFAAIDKGEIAGIFNGPETTLSSAGYGSVITGGEIYEGGLVDDADAELTITEYMRAAYRALGFYLRRKS